MEAFDAAFSGRRNPCWYYGRVLLPLLLVLGGCAQNDKQDLEKYIQEVRQNQKGRIKPLPQFEPFETYRYGATGMRSPFVRWKDKTTTTQRRSNAGPQPKEGRRRERLEKYPLDSLSLVGTLKKDSSEWALVKAPDGMVHRVQVGNYMGQNHGKILKLSEQGIVLRELVPDGLGGWRKRRAEVALDSD